MSVRSPTRSFWTFWAGISVSSLGDGITAVALPLIALGWLDAGPRGVSLVIAANYAAWLLVGLPAGVLISRFQLQRLQVLLDLFRALALISIPVAGYFGALSLGQLVVVALLLGLAAVLHEVGSASYLPLIVGPAELAMRNGWISGAYATAQVAGPSLGGLLVQAVGAPIAVLADVSSYLFSACCISSLPRQDKGAATNDELLGAAVRRGVQYVLGRSGLVASCVVLASLNFVCGGVQTLGPVYLIVELHQSPLMVGTLLGMEGLGGIAGAASAGIFATRADLRTLTVVFTASCGVATAALALARPGYFVAYFAAGNVLLGFGLAGVSTSLRTYRQSTTPPAMLPRVMATVRFVSWGALPVGALAAGALAPAMGIRWVLLVLGSLGLLAALYARMATFSTVVSTEAA